MGPNVGPAGTSVLSEGPYANTTRGTISGELTSEAFAGLRQPSEAFEREGGADRLNRFVQLEPCQWRVA